ncbi:ATP-binding cassette sub-family C member 5-like [Ischnura elegans]|uniref:ATP-binding cassette sub-family C member 5-like n=1 Tax=Ischnura elegans TaxID=197161 RepID=UPI001ED86A71|nr:ATP-binding cassette sub-family C member 5-like [Ischnura elegans]XP_046390512.1 ATP-binding cassette sub-family C member 5-like [Ischnura elegans]XP_046390513.1 ATP-binding cassette sub-family C member 5-like [Ischnura elegans]XP_046390514.1 ATP-binding cassette sub-family C member 5-like [Ischnura elegans]XP_046390515.1 ATP-binding cassette sub-family C member 5-like [Ischnura elegans]
MALHKWLSNGSIFVSFEDSARRGERDGANNQDMEARRSGERSRTNSKYLPSLMNLLPYRKSAGNKKMLPSNNAGLFSFVSLSWLTSTMWKAYKKGLTVEDLFELQESDRAEGTSRRLERLWCEEESQKGRNSSLPLVVWRFVRTRAIVAMALMVFAVIFQFAGPAWIQRFILDYVEDPSQPLEWGFSLVGILFMCQLLRNYCFGGSYVLGLHTGVRVQGALQFLIYKKMLLLHSGGEKALSQVITFCTNEQERIFEAVSMGVLILGTPVMFTMSVVYSCQILGPWALLGNLIILLFYPLMAVIASFTSHVRVQTVRITDQRVSLMSEILNNIKLIKMYAWEASFTDKICQVREEERRSLQKAAFLQSFSNTVTPSITLLASISTFLGYSLSGHPLYPAQAFTIFSVFTAMQFSVGTLPYGIKCLAEATVSLRKMQKFLQRHNHKPNIIKPSKDGTDEVKDMVLIKDGSFAWDILEEDIPPTSQPKHSKKRICKKHRGAVVKSNSRDNKEISGIFLGKDDEREIPPATLQGINFSLKKGKLVAVCGGVGSGKSSLLSAVMGDMLVVSGRVEVNGSIAVVSQQAWIFNDTVQENILFGLPLDHDRYKNVLDVCCLNRDLKLLPNGDMTEIGERGTNLSGGQKQRISIARAVYAEKEIILLDDPLSAVDARVARRIFEYCIRGALKDRTILFATHSLQFLPECDEIIFLKDGVISERGTHEELMSLAGDYYQLMQFDETRKENSESDNKPKPSRQDSEQSPVREFKGGEAEGKMTAAEEHSMQRTGYKAFLRFSKYCGGYWVMASLLCLILLFTLARLFSGIWLQIWLDEGDGSGGAMVANWKANSSIAGTNLTENELKGSVNDNPYLWFYQTIYGLSFVVLMTIGLVKGVGIARQLLFGSSALHDTMLRKVMKCPISFFDITPPGRILQRFSRDMDEMDVRVPFFFEFVWQGLMYVITQLVLVCFIFPVFSIALSIASGLFAFLDIWLNKGLKEAKKIDNFLKSPVLNHIASSMAGLSVIRAYGRHRVFLERFCARLNHTLASDFMFRSSIRWFTFRMDMIAVATVTLISLIVVLLRSSVSSAQAGLALSCVFGVSTFVPYVMQLKSEMQARFTSVERILEYAEELEEEENVIMDPEDKGCTPEDVVIVPPMDWPQNGDIEFNNVQLRHRPNLPLVLFGINAKIAGGEKVGVVGRTGAGKSSLLGALLRLVKLSAGNIKIDGIDVSKVCLHKLRSTIAIIPQDPVLFHGTLRYNLDPFSEHADESIWQALEKSHLKDKVMKEDKQLLMVVESDGENFSVGEKQLICLARALLRRNKILLLDEATASVDLETDSLIQNTVREEFSSCTVITIAHRIHTITSYDRVMVLDAGKVVEFDKPEALMIRPDSQFHQMMEAAGISTFSTVN